MKGKFDWVEVFLFGAFLALLLMLAGFVLTTIHADYSHRNQTCTNWTVVVSGKGSAHFKCLEWGIDNTNN